MSGEFDPMPWLLGLCLAAAEWSAALGVAILAWELMRRDVELGVVAGLCALLLAVLGWIAGAAFCRAVRGR